MTFRLEVRRTRDTVRIALSGALDRDALDALRTAIEAARREGVRSVTLALGTGTSIEIDRVSQLGELGDLTVETSSPFLTHWLRQAGLRTHNERSRS